MAEDFCNGIPLGLARKGVIDYSDPSYTPLTDAEVFDRAAAHLDTGLTLSAAQTDAHSASVQTGGAVIKARILLDQGQFSQAAALVPAWAVPTSYQYLLTFAQTSGDNKLWSLNTNQGRYTVGRQFRRERRDQERGAVRVGQGLAGARDGPKKKGFDGQTNLFNYYGTQRSTPLVSGIDARLIEAEAKLRRTTSRGR